MISETDSIADQDLSSSELTTGNQAGQFSKTDTQVEEDLSTESVVTDESEEALTEELSVDNQPSSESEIASESVKQLWIATLRMSWLITMLRRLK